MHACVMKNFRFCTGSKWAIRIELMSLAGFSRIQSFERPARGCKLISHHRLTCQPLPPPSLPRCDTADGCVCAAPLELTMFYTSHLLIKGAPLGILWLAGQFAKKVTKKMVQESDVVEDW